MYKLVYMGSYNERIFESIVSFTNIKCVAGIIDYSRKEEEINKTKDSFKEFEIPEIRLEDLDDFAPDVVFMCNYSRILRSHYIEKYAFVNIHAGILPKWRGKNANCWAILNGETEVGYTIHRVNAELDDGEIYHIVRARMQPNETYYEVRERLKDELNGVIETVFEGIVTGSIDPCRQNREGIIYNPKLRESDGDIICWNKPTSFIYGLFKVFYIKPYGSGVRIFINNEPYEVLDMSVADEIGESYGIPGSVIYKTSDGYSYIKTADTAVKIGRLKSPSELIVSSSDVLRIGMRL